MNNGSTLNKEDYVEPRCVLGGKPFGSAPEIKPVPQKRIVDKLDEYMSRRDYDGAERHLLYWLEEAKLGGDQRGELMIRNELVGHFRKTGKKTEAYENARAALQLVRELDFDGTISSGTTYTNIGTAYQAFGDHEMALSCFHKAKEIYENSPAARRDLLGGLCNNMALTCVSLKRFKEAYELYDSAMEHMKNVENGELEQAITLLNIADAVEAETGAEEGEARISDLVERAYDLLMTPSVPRDGYYAFVCEKCAPSFDYYGWFLAAKELRNKAEEIYARS